MPSYRPNLRRIPLDPCEAAQCPDPLDSPVAYALLGRWLILGGVVLCGAAGLLLWLAWRPGP